MQVTAVIFFAKEARLTVVPALHDVERYAIKVDSGAAGHDRRLSRKYIEPGPFNCLKEC